MVCFYKLTFYLIDVLFCCLNMVMSITVTSWQHQHMIRMSSVSIQMSDFAMDLKKCWVVTGKLFLISDLQVIFLLVVLFFFCKFYLFLLKLL